MSEKSKLGAILVQSRLISPEDIKRALEEQKRSKIRFGEALIKLGIIQEEDVGWGLSNQLNVPFIRLTTDTIDMDAVQLVPEPLARRHRLVPFLKIENELTVVIEDPLNKRAIAEVQAVTGCRVNLCIGLPAEILTKIDEVYGTRASPTSDISELAFDLFTSEQLDKVKNDFSGELFLLTLLDHAIENEAAAIHFVPSGSEVNVQFRANGGLETVGKVSEGWYLVLNNRIKSLLDLMETRDNFIEGFVPHTHQNRKYVFYASIVSTKLGSAVTFLNLTPRKFPDNFDGLALDDKDRESVLQIIGGRMGLAMVVGPGKIEKLNFITLLLNKKHAEMKKTFAIGSAPWFVDTGYVQLNVQTENKKEMLEGIKVALTQNPDILFVEDLWDRQVLEFALQSSMTNTFILSTLHFPDTLTALEYLNESIPNKSLLTQSLRGLIGVHVFRVLCPKCKKVDDDYVRQSRVLNLPRAEVEKASIYEPVGCEHCNSLGYERSKILVEPLVMDPKIGDLLKAGHKFQVIKGKIVAQGHRTIEQQAKKLVLAGEICIGDFKNVERR